MMEHKTRANFAEYFSYLKHSIQLKPSGKQVVLLKLLLNQENYTDRKEWCYLQWFITFSHF